MTDAVAHRELRGARGAGGGGSLARGAAAAAGGGRVGCVGRAREEAARPRRARAVCGGCAADGGGRAGGARVERRTPHPSESPLTGEARTQGANRCAV